MVAEREAKTIGATLGYVQPEAPLDTLTHICRRGGRVSWRDVEEVKRKAFVHRQADRIRQLMVKTSSDTLCNKEAQTHTGGTASRGGSRERQRYARHCALRALLHALVERLAQVEPEIQRNTVADVRADGIVDILADTLAK